MKLGFVSAILDGWTFEEMIDVAHDMGYTCVEVEDLAFEGSRERILDSLRISKRYLEQFVI